MFSRIASWSEKDPIENSPHVGNAANTQQLEARLTEIHVSKDVCSVTFLGDGKHVVGSGYGGKVGVWQTADGLEVGTSMNAGSTVLNVVVSLDGKWVVCGTKSGLVIIWNTERHEKVIEFHGHGNWVRAIDVSPDMTRVASGSDDKTACIWSTSSGERLLDPLEHGNVLAAVKFSPNGDLLATATWWEESVRIYDTQNGCLLIDLPIRVTSYENQSLVWLLNSTLLLALSFNGDIKCFDVSTRTMHSHWSVHTGGNTPKCMVVANNQKFIAVSADSFVFFWDTTTLKQIGPVIEHTDTIHSIAISPNYDLAAGGGKTITIRSLGEILPSQYVDGAMYGIEDTVNRFNIVANPETPTPLQRPPSEAPSRAYNEFCSNDLTHHVRRDGHDPVASGGFADIYRGLLQTNWEPIRVAIKVIRTYSVDDGSFFKKQKRLRREMKVWLTLKHTNVLPLLGTATGFGRFPAMVCPWIDNGSLTTYLGDRHDELSAVEILTLLNDAASGLQYLHSCSVVHGDLSGSNVLVCKNGRAYISDFGLSTLLTEIGGPTFATSVHERGTLRWTAPELLDLEISEDDAEPAKVVPTKHSDVYSFGGVMLQILTGKVPYHYYTREVQVVNAVSRGMTPRRPSSGLVTERRWMFIQWCWSTVDPSQTRPSSDDIAYFANDELSGVITP